MPDLVIEDILDESAVRTDEDQRRIDEIVKRFPLPSHMQDRFMNRKQVADLINADEKQVDRYLRAGLPLVEKGNNGRPYKFRLSECWAWFKNREFEKKREEEEAAAAIAQASLELLGGSVGTDSEMGLTTAQRRDLYRLDADYRDMALARGELVPRGDVDAILNKVFDVVRKAIIGLPDRLARDAGLSGRQAESVVDATDDILTELNRELDRFAEDHSDETALLAAE